MGVRFLECYDLCSTWALASATSVPGTSLTPAMRPELGSVVASASVAFSRANVALSRCVPARARNSAFCVAGNSKPGLAQRLREAPQPLTISR